MAQLLSGHVVVTVQRAGYKGLANGELLRRAAGDGYDVLLTADRNRARTPTRSLTVGRRS